MQWCLGIGYYQKLGNREVGFVVEMLAMIILWVAPQKPLLARDENSKHFNHS